LTQELMLAELFEQVAKEIDAKLAANWLMRDMMKLINESDMESVEIDEKEVIDVLDMFEKEEITNLVAKDLLRGLIENKVKRAREYVKSKGLGKISHGQDIKKWCLDAIEKNPKAVADYKAGQEKALDALLGHVMRISNKKANPDAVKTCLFGLLK
ncbi:hypothetical protein HYT58_03000, partial [Candidatus Woesearchaeota archaeon]|nr:hypothetical protein [Candidatus Woesearchaeota archaeon]